VRLSFNLGEDRQGLKFNLSGWIYLVRDICQLVSVLLKSVKQLLKFDVVKGSG
jgi:hypothetical protein